MSEFFAFLQLGFRHITDPGGLDHVLFLLALAAIYRFRDWAPLLAVVTAFTLGHSISLALAVTGMLAISPTVIEFLIPITIIATCVENILVRDRDGALWHRRFRPIFAGVFGLVHGAGFANYLRSLFLEELTVPLLGFNVGLEVGQILVLATAGVLFLGVDRVLAGGRLAARVGTPLRLRAVTVSSAVAMVAAAWAWERSPW